MYYLDISIKHFLKEKMSIDTIVIWFDQLDEYQINILSKT
jgi:hypothetical protein